MNDAFNELLDSVNYINGVPIMKDTETQDRNEWVDLIIANAKDFGVWLEKILLIKSGLELLV